MKSRWKKILKLSALVLFVLFVSGAVFCLIPSPPPKVSLKFQGFTMRGTNVMAQICLTNEGPQEIWWESSFMVISETKFPGTQKYETRFLDLAQNMVPRSGLVKQVEVPKDFDRWNINAPYHYLNHWGAVQIGLERWLYQHQTSIFFKPAFWCVQQIPGSKLKVGQVSSEYFTNHPPMPPISVPAVR